jgi:protein tyrosine phosphatase (PTP) superfamily phosphohydrolase (DUF442 family)
MKLIAAASWLIVGIVAAFALAQEAKKGKQDETIKPTKVDAPHLPNAFHLHEKVISGGLPEGDKAFEELKRLGVKTVISVDGAKPDVAIAKKYGMRYVHLPHGYDGIPEGRAQELAKAVHDLPGPIYIHCHHGKHRSPAAATVACVATGLLEPADALGVLKTAGTSENYRGLYQSAESARRIDDTKLAALKADFPETADLPPMAEAMVAIEHTHDHLKSIAAAKWKSPTDHPDLDPAHEVLLLREHFTELLRTDAVKREPARFGELAKEGEAAAGDLETILREPSLSTDRATKAFEKVTNNCTACHREFRDVPLGEKSAR